MADFVRDRLAEKRWSTNDVAERAKRAGFDINRSYVTRVINRDYTNPTIETLRALAVGLDVSPSKVFAAALQIDSEIRRKREVTLPQYLWDALDASAEQNRRGSDSQLEELVAPLLVQDVGPATKSQYDAQIDMLNRAMNRLIQRRDRLVEMEPKSLSY